MSTGLCDLCALPIRTKTCLMYVIDGEAVQTDGDWRFVSRERMSRTMLCDGCAGWIHGALSGRRRQIAERHP